MVPIVKEPSTTMSERKIQSDHLYTNGPIDWLECEAIFDSQFPMTLPKPENKIEIEKQLKRLNRNLLEPS